MASIQRRIKPGSDNLRVTPTYAPPATLLQLAEPLATNIRSVEILAAS
jgi:hypothetical protein